MPGCRGRIRRDPSHPHAIWPRPGRTTQVDEMDPYDFVRGNLAWMKSYGSISSTCDLAKSQVDEMDPYDFIHARLPRTKSYGSISSTCVVRPGRGQIACG